MMIDAVGAFARDNTRRSYRTMPNGKTLIVGSKGREETDANKPVTKRYLIMMRMECNLIDEQEVGFTVIIIMRRIQFFVDAIDRFGSQIAKNTNRWHSWNTGFAFFRLMTRSACDLFLEELREETGVTKTRVFIPTKPIAELRFLKKRRNSIRWTMIDRSFEGTKYVIIE